MHLSRTLLVAAIMAFVLSAPADVWAKDKVCTKCQYKQSESKQCPAKAKYHKKADKKGKKDLKDKFFAKAKFYLAKKDKIGLSDAQVRSIKDLKVAAKKDLIMKKAEIKVVALDIKSHLQENTVNTGAVHALIDKKYELKKAKSKTLVDAYAQLKTILTDQQKEKVKEIWQQKRDKGGKKSS